MKLSSGLGRGLLLGGGLVLLFVAIVVVLAKVMPGPHSPRDYLVIGTLATFASMAVLFVVLISTSMKGSDIFFKRRKDDSK